MTPTTPGVKASERPCWAAAAAVGLRPVGGEGVQAGVHCASELDVGLTTPIMGTLCAYHTPWNNHLEKAASP